MGHQCIQEARIRKLEDKQRDTSNDIRNLTNTVGKVIAKLDTLIKVLLLIAAKVGVGLIILLGYLIKTYVV